MVSVLVFVFVHARSRVLNLLEIVFISLSPFFFSHYAYYIIGFCLIFFLFFSLQVYIILLVFFSPFFWILPLFFSLFLIYKSLLPSCSNSWHSSLLLKLTYKELISVDWLLTIVILYFIFVCYFFKFYILFHHFISYTTSLFLGPTFIYFNPPNKKPNVSSTPNIMIHAYFSLSSPSTFVFLFQNFLLHLLNFKNKNLLHIT